MGWNVVVSYVRVDTIMLHCLPSGQNCAQFHLQLLKLNKKPAVAVTEAVRFIRKASVEMSQPIQGTVIHRWPAYSTNKQRGSQWLIEAEGATSVRSRVQVYDTSIHKYNICRFAVLSRTNSTVGLSHSWHAYAGTSRDDSCRVQRHDERYTL